MGEEWKETPAECEGFLSHFSDFMEADVPHPSIDGALMTEDLKLHTIGESVAAVNEYMNGLLTIEQMKKAELIAFADRYFDVELKQSMRKSAMIEKIQELAEPPYEGIEDS